MDRYAVDNSPHGFVVTGDSGSGKSSLLANWAAHWKEANPHDEVFLHWTGISPQSAEHVNLMQRLIWAIQRWARPNTENREIPTEAEELAKSAA